MFSLNTRVEASKVCYYDKEKNRKMQVKLDSRLIVLHTCAYDGNKNELTRDCVFAEIAFSRRLMRNFWCLQKNSVQFSAYVPFNIEWTNLFVALRCAYIDFVEGMGIPFRSLEIFSTANKFSES